VKDHDTGTISKFVVFTRKPRKSLLRHYLQGAGPHYRPHSLLSKTFWFIL